jgi:hypothetical protein
MDNTSATLAGVAAHVRAGETQVLADEIHQERTSLYVAANGVTVNGHGYGWHFGVSSFDRRIRHSLCKTKNNAPRPTGKSRRRFMHQIISVACSD